MSKLLAVQVPENSVSETERALWLLAYLRGRETGIIKCIAELEIVGFTKKDKELTELYAQLGEIQSALLLAYVGGNTQLMAVRL